MMKTPKAVYLRPVLEVRLVAELLTVPKKVMACFVELVVCEQLFRLRRVRLPE